MSRAQRSPWAWLPWLALPFAPVQGVWITRTVPRLAEAEGRTGSVGPDGADRPIGAHRPAEAGPDRLEASDGPGAEDGPGGVGGSTRHRLKVVALGDSVTAGYALAHHRDSVAGQLATRLARRDAAWVDWQVAAVSGYTAGQALTLVSPEVLHDADLVFVSAGVNDVKGLHTVRRFRRELGTLLDAILTAAPRASVCLLGIPPLESFPALPRPLADVLGWRGRTFDAVGAAAIAARVRALRIVTYEPLALEMFAADGFHPSERLHAAFADAVMEVLAEEE